MVRKKQKWRTKTNNQDTKLPAGRLAEKELVDLWHERINVSHSLRVFSVIVRDTRQCVCGHYQLIALSELIPESARDSTRFLGRVKDSFTDFFA